MLKKITLAKYRKILHFFNHKEQNKYFLHISTYLKNELLWCDCFLLRIKINLKTITKIHRSSFILPSYDARYTPTLNM